MTLLKVFQAIRKIRQIVEIIGDVSDEFEREYLKTQAKKANESRKSSTNPG